MRKSLLLVGLVVTTGALGGAVWPVGTKNAARELAVLVSPMALGAMPVDVDSPFEGQCAWCPTCSYQQFDGQIAKGEGWWEDQPCQIQVCPYRGGCWHEEEDASVPGRPNRKDVVGVWNAVVSNDISAVRDALMTYPEYFIVNKTRSSFQLVGCDGVTIMANVPLTEGGMKALLDGLPL